MVSKYRFVYPYVMSNIASTGTIKKSISKRYSKTDSERTLTVPIVLFVLTCFSTFWVGITNWRPTVPLQSPDLDSFFNLIRMQVLANWEQGLMYMASLLLILLLHEFGHFFTTLYYRVPATPPIFLPFPFNPIGTLGAVIGMQGTQADRKQIFDIGIAGQLAGLVVAIPLAYWGCSQLDLTTPPRGGIGFRLPLLMQWMVSGMSIQGYDAAEPIVWINQLNPLFAAAWVGLLITGLNMMPVGQLDGGHIAYTLFGDAAKWIAEAMIVFAIAFMVYQQHYLLILMVVLILLIGTQHPPTSDDTVKIGPWRWALGFFSLFIPVLCFPPLVFTFVY
ncbi:MAG: site-2 protease family protein [Planctomycetota bacterium]